MIATTDDKNICNQRKWSTVAQNTLECRFKFGVNKMAVIIRQNFNIKSWIIIIFCLCKHNDDYEVDYLRMYYDWNVLSVYISFNQIYLLIIFLAFGFEKLDRLYVNTFIFKTLFCPFNYNQRKANCHRPHKWLINSLHYAFSHSINSFAFSYLSDKKVTYDNLLLTSWKTGGIFCMQVLSFIFII